MKYFTDELWSKYNSDISEERKQADIEWKQNSDAYYKVFESIKERIT
jgi:hypothetical protein